MDKERLFLHNRYCPGDYTASLIAIESLHIQYPNRFLTHLDSCCPWIYQHNPYVTKMKREQCRYISLETPELDHLHQREVHIGQAYCEWLGEQLRLPLKQMVPAPTITL